MDIMGFARIFGWNLLEASIICQNLRICGHRLGNIGVGPCRSIVVLLFSILAQFRNTQILFIRTPLFSARFSRNFHRTYLRVSGQWFQNDIGEISISACWREVVSTTHSTPPPQPVCVCRRSWRLQTVPCNQSPIPCRGYSNPVSSVLIAAIDNLTTDRFHCVFYWSPILQLTCNELPYPNTHWHYAYSITL